MVFILTFKGDKVMMPSINTSYCNNSAQNNVCVTVGTTKVWFSYETPVAFQVLGHDVVCHQNDWGRTTGKHLNQIADKSVRVSSEEFYHLWEEQHAGQIT